jgi:hypothetical protein
LEIYSARTFFCDVKFLYCPKCKELRAKAWYQMRPRCSRCIGPATEIAVRNGPLTYLTYFLYFFVPGLVILSITWDDRTYLWYAVAGLVVMVVVAMTDIGRAQAIAKKRVRITSSNLHEFRKRGWL